MLVFGPGVLKVPQMVPVQPLPTVVQFTLAFAMPTAEPAKGRVWPTSTVAGGTVDMVTLTTCSVKVAVCVTGAVELSWTVACTV